MAGTFYTIEFKNAEKSEKLKNLRNAWLLSGNKAKLKQKQIIKNIALLGASEMINLQNITYVGDNYFICKAFGWGENNVMLFFFDNCGKLTTVLLKKNIAKVYVTPVIGEKRLVWKNKE